MKNYIILLITMLFLVSFTDAKSVSKSNIKPQRREELEDSPDTVNLNSHETSEVCDCCSCPCPCRPQPDCTSSCIAIKAAQEARAAAAAQQIAAAQASHQVVVQLAEKAVQAAKAAEAALVGKLIHVNQLQKEVCVAQAVVMEEAASCQRTQINLQISLTAAAHAQQLLKTLMCALRICETTLCYSQQLVQGTAEELAEKLALLEAAKCRLNILMRELCVARQDLAAISQAVCRARAAARCACCSAQRCRRLSRRVNAANEDLKELLDRILQSGREVSDLIQKLSKQ